MICHLIYFHLKASFMQEALHTAVIPNLLTLSCIIVGVIRCVLTHVGLYEVRHAAHTKDPNAVNFVRSSAAFLCSVASGGSAVSVKSSDVRASPPLRSHLLQLISALWGEWRVLLRRRFNKSTTFWWLCCSILLSVCVCFQTFLCVSLLCVRVRVCSLDLW